MPFSIMPQSYGTIWSTGKLNCLILTSAPHPALHIPMSNDTQPHSAETKKVKASIVSAYSDNEGLTTECLPDEFVQGICSLEKHLEMPIWLLVQNEEYRHIDPGLYEQFFDQRDSLPEDQPAALLIHSNGGDTTAAYKLAALLVKRCGAFTALIPSCAKSAATLIAIGSSEIILGRYAELGPLDIQVLNEKDEKMESALNHVQALERLGADSMRVMDAMVRMLLSRMDKPMNDIVRVAIEFSTSLVRPLMENIDVVEYTRRSRELKMGEEYAIRLLRHNYHEIKAKRIARSLVSNYPDHGFVIDIHEAKAIGLDATMPHGEVAEAYTQILPYLDGRLAAIGSLNRNL